MYIHMYKDACMYICTYVRTYVYLYVRTCMCAIGDVVFCHNISCHTMSYCVISKCMLLHHSLFYSILLCSICFGCIYTCIYIYICITRKRGGCRLALQEATYSSAQSSSESAQEPPGRSLEGSFYPFHESGKFQTGAEENLLSRTQLSAPGVR